MIHGYAGSTAEAYAAKYGRKFELISGEPPIKPVENDILYGDVSENDGITNLDALTIQKFMLELITKLPE